MPWRRWWRAEYQDWLDTLPKGLEDSATAERLREI